MHSSRRLGPLGEVGPLAFGCWRFVGHDLAGARSLLETALELGMNLVDTADVYGLDWGGQGFGAAEELLGKVLAEAPHLRQSMVLATKGGIVPGIPYDSSPEHLRRACEDSLRRLGVDVIDLYQIHRPDLFAHPADVAATLTALFEEGKVRAVGVSNHTVSQVDALAAHLEIPFVSSQPQFSAAHLDPLRDGTLDQCMRLDLRPLAWSPLAGGSIATGEGLRSELTFALGRIAADHGVDRATIGLAFVLGHPSRPVAIVGTQSPGRLSEVARSVEVELSRRELYDVIQSSEGERLP